MPKTTLKLILSAILLLQAPWSNANHFSPATTEHFVANHFDFGNTSGAFNQVIFTQIGFDQFWNKDFFNLAAHKFRDNQNALKTVVQIFKRLKKPEPLPNRQRSQDNQDPQVAPPGAFGQISTDDSKILSEQTNVLPHATVPEPSALMILLLGMFGLTLSRAVKNR